MVTAGVEYRRLSEPTVEIAARIEKWENDAELVPFTRPSTGNLDERSVVSVDTLKERLRRSRIFLIYEKESLVGEMSYQVDPPYLYRKVPGTAWIGITIGEKSARHKGIGTAAMRFLEDEIRRDGLRRIELGVFEFNESARRLYLKLGYTEIGRIENFTHWNGRMWRDIRMEKLL